MSGYNFMHIPDLMSSDYGWAVTGGLLIRVIQRGLTELKGNVGPLAEVCTPILASCKSCEALCDILLLKGAT